MTSATGRAVLPSKLLPYLGSFLKRVKTTPSNEVHNGQSQPHIATRLRRVKVGLCVSGGPDSMALAYLLKNLPVIDSVKLDTLAFIVDHKARSGSTEEASRVQGFLQEIGVPAKVLTMKWPEGVKPLALSNFESQARYLRYRLIATNAIDEGIDHLFVGHHQDDQVETVLMRLIRQLEPGLLGLRGISSESPIPCCDDIYGAHEQIWSPQLGVLSQQREVEPSYGKPALYVDLGRVAPSAPGGILLHRPLLTFPKVDLIMTCQKHNVPFVVDLTNKDPRSNMRNAVRYMRSNHSLPKALSPTGVLELQSRAQNSLSQTSSSGAIELSKFLIKRLDLRTGTLVIELPHLCDNDAGSLRSISDAILTFVEIVTPNPRSDKPLQLPQKVFDILFPKANSANNSTFTFRHVTFTPHPTQTRDWILSRQHMRVSECDMHQWSFRPPRDNIQNTEKTVWRLWDGRFWIRLTTRNMDQGEIVIAPFAMYADKLSNQARDDLKPYKKFLVEIAPGRRKLTLPVLIYHGHVIGFPTLDLKLPQTMLSLGVHIDWEVRYKAVKHMKHLRVADSDTGTFEERLATSKTLQEAMTSITLSSHQVTEKYGPSS